MDASKWHNHWEERNGLVNPRMYGRRGSHLRCNPDAPLTTKISDYLIGRRRAAGLLFWSRRAGVAEVIIDPPARRLFRHRDGLILS